MNTVVWEVWCGGGDKTRVQTVGRCFAKKRTIKSSTAEEDLATQLFDKDRL